ncbi:MAG TPA: CBS domain-containing protein [candidate division Zixibacteria bacterium]
MNEKESKVFIFFSELLRRKLSDSQGKIIGKLVDLKVGLGELFPKVVCLCIKIKNNRQTFTLDWERVDKIEEEKLVLKPESASLLLPLEVGEKEILLREEMLDKQVVDTYGVRIERVNDLHLLIAGSELRLVHVDFGIRGILRRLGWVKSVDALTEWFFSYKIPQKLLSWKYIQPLSRHAGNQALKLNLTHRKLDEIHPSDLADLLEDLDKHERLAVFKSLGLEAAAETLEEVEPKLQRDLIETDTTERASDILEEMAPDEAADLLSELPPEKTEAMIQGMETTKRKELEGLLAHPEGTAGSIMTLDYIALKENETAEEALRRFKRSDYHSESSSYIYITDDQGKLKGVVTLRSLLICPSSTLLSTIMNRRVIKVKLEDKVEEVAEKFKKYNLLMVPVVDGEKKIKGVITFHDVVDSIFPDFEG